MADNRSFETTLHDIVYSVDTGTGLKIIRGGLYFLILIVVVMVYTATQFRGLNSEESMDFAQLGRSMAAEQKMTTKCVRPLSMWKLAELSPRNDAQVQGHPDLFHPPAYPAVLALGFKVFELAGIDPFEVSASGPGMGMPAEKWVVLPVNHIFSILTGVLVFLMGKRMFSHEIGFMGITIYYLSDLVWSDSISGLNVSMAVFFIVASFHAMMVAMLNRRDGESKVRWIVPFMLSIVCAAIAFLTRYIAIAAVPGLCLFAWSMGGRFRGGTRFVLVFVLLYALMIAPWLARNYSICGNPMGMAGYTALAHTSEYPDNSLARDLNPELTASKSVAALKEKWVQNYSGRHGTVIPSMGGGILMAFFLTTYFYHFIRPQVNHLRWGVGLSLLLTLVLAGFFSDSSIAMVHAFWPFAILYALAFFYILIDRLDLGVRLYNMLLKCLIVLLATLPFWLRLLPPHEKSTYPPYYVPAISKVSALLRPWEAMCSDMPWATAWYGNRVSILLPEDMDQFYEIVGYHQYISGLYITSITKDKGFVSSFVGGPEQDWWSIMNGSVPPDFPLKETLQLNRQYEILLSDRKRWLEPGAATGEPTQ